MPGDDLVAARLRQPLPSQRSKRLLKALAHSVAQPRRSASRSARSQWFRSIDPISPTPVARVNARPAARARTSGLPAPRWLSTTPAGRASVVCRKRVGFERDVVAEPLGLLVGVGVAADPGEQARSSRRPPARTRQPEPLAHPQRDQASAGSRAPSAARAPGRRPATAWRPVRQGGHESGCSAWLSIASRFV